MMDTASMMLKYLIIMKHILMQELRRRQHLHIHRKTAVIIHSGYTEESAMRLINHHMRSQRQYIISDLSTMRLLLQLEVRTE